MLCKFRPLQRADKRSVCPPYILEGAYIRITFLNMSYRVFSSWIYSEVNEDKEIVESYEFRFINIEEETMDMTKECYLDKAYS